MKNWFVIKVKTKKFHTQEDMKMSETRELVRKLDKAIDVLKVEDGMIQQLADIRVEACEIDGRRWRGFLWGKKGIIAFIILLCPLDILPVIASVLPFLKTIVGVILVLWPLWLVLAIYGVYRIAKKKNAELDEEYNELEKKWNAVQDKIKAYEEENRETLSVLAEDYWDYNCANILKGYIVKGRADSLKEAYNLFEEEAYRERMEAKQQEMIEEQQRTSAYAAEAAKQAKRAAIMAAAASFEADMNRR